MVNVLHKFAVLFVAIAAGGGALAASAPRVLPFSVGVAVAGAAALGLLVLLVEGYVRGPQDTAPEP
jgi:hypothetical protein